MEYLNKDFFGNSIQHWIIAFLVLIGSFLLVKILYWIFSSVFNNLTNKTKTNLDDILLKNFRFSAMDMSYVFWCIIKNFMH